MHLKTPFSLYKPPKMSFLVGVSTPLFHIYLPQLWSSHKYSVKVVAATDVTVQHSISRLNVLNRVCDIFYSPSSFFDTLRVFLFVYALLKRPLRAEKLSSKPIVGAQLQLFLKFRSLYVRVHAGSNFHPVVPCTAREVPCFLRAWKVVAIHFRITIIARFVSICGILFTNT